MSKTICNTKFIVDFQGQIGQKGQKGHLFSPVLFPLGARGDLYNLLPFKWVKLFATQNLLLIYLLLIYLEDVKNYWSLNVSRTVNKLIMRVHKPKVE